MDKIGGDLVGTVLPVRKENRVMWVHTVDIKIMDGEMY